MSLVRRTLLALAALPVLYLPLRAAETPPPTPPTEQPAAPEEEEDAQPTEVTPATAPPANREPDPGERLSLDNNISFPVDI